MPTGEFKYYALHYLNLWISQEETCYKALAGNDDSLKLDALARAATFFRIARTLRTCHDKGKGLPRYRPVLDIINSLDPAEFQGKKLLPSINKVRDRISKKYGGRGALSATTKFLWLKMRSPIVIYDSQARKALGVDNIEDYYSKWRDKFDGYDRQIRDACTSLQNVHEYTKKPQVTTPEYIAETTAQPWFRERVFDVYLWQRGLDGLDA